jgi:hypothetical protein
MHKRLLQLDGINETGPDSSPMRRYKISLSGRDVIVDMNFKFRSELGEWTRPESYLSLHQLIQSE